MNILLEFQTKSYVCEVAHDVCYEGSIKKNLFVSFVVNKSKVAYFRPFQTPSQMDRARNFCSYFLKREPCGSTLITLLTLLFTETVVGGILIQYQHVKILVWSALKGDALQRLKVRTTFHQLLQIIILFCLSRFMPIHYPYPIEQVQDN